MPWNDSTGYITYFPDKSVTWTNVSLKEAKMWATPKTSSPSRTWGPSWTWTSSVFSFFPLRGAILRWNFRNLKRRWSYQHHKNIQKEVRQLKRKQNKSCTVSWCVFNANIFKKCQKLQISVTLVCSCATWCFQSVIRGKFKLLIKYLSFNFYFIFQQPKNTFKKLKCMTATIILVAVV